MTGNGRVLKVFFMPSLKLYTAGILLLLQTAVLSSQNGQIGLGITLGNPTGITAQYRTGENTAVSAVFGRQISGINHLLLAADFLYHPWTFDSENDVIRLYAGPGIGLGFVSDLNISLRAPLGGAYFFHSLPLQMFAEFVPALILKGEEGIRFRPGGYLGLRWFFYQNSGDM